MKAAIAAALLAAALWSPAGAFDLQGHRGARGLAPENTLPAFAVALRLGVATLEFDTLITRDDRLVVGHDPVLLPKIVRDAEGRFLAAPGPAVRSLGFDELRRFDVGRINPADRYAQQFPEQQPIDGTRMPALEEVFALANRSGNRAVRFNIETKSDPGRPDLAPPPEAFTDRLVAAIRAAGLADRTTIQSFDWRTLKRVGEVAPEIPRVCLTAEQRWLDNVQIGRPGASAWTAGLDVDDFGGSVPKLVQAAGCAIWSPAFPDLTAARLAEAKSLGLKVVVWTVNDAAEMARLIDLGVDGIISDYPDRLRKVAGDKGLALPAATPLLQ
ncbi:glycerophosphodiester phosphodiesterase [Desertibaculum subflavum]|uniref:glycerophosphodiester phosphodiesterase n=1 Tax=Desertibaculum subflavum TaxID=2268458 RepID=UPI000E66A590